MNEAQGPNVTVQQGDCFYQGVKLVPEKPQFFTVLLFSGNHLLETLQTGMCPEGNRQNEEGFLSLQFY